MEKLLVNLTYGKCLAIGLAITAFYYFSGIYNSGEDLANSITQAQSEISTKERRIATIKKAVEDADRYKDTMQQLGSEMEKVTKALPEDFASIELLKIISTTAKNVGVNISKLSDATDRNMGSSMQEGPEVYEPISADVEIVGTYNQIMTFLSNLTQVDRLLKPQNLKISIGQSSPGDRQMPNVQLTSKILGYKYRPPKKVEEVAQ